MTKLQGSKSSKIDDNFLPLFNRFQSFLNQQLSPDRKNEVNHSFPENTCRRKELQEVTSKTNYPNISMTLLIQDNEKCKSKIVSTLIHPNDMEEKRSKLKKKPDTLSKKTTLERIKKYATPLCLNILKEKKNICLQKWTLEVIPKKYLKKCRWCGYKKRRCFSNPNFCSAFNKECFSCNKVGHFPKSILCKSKSIQNADFVNKKSFRKRLTPSQVDFEIIVVKTNNNFTGSIDTWFKNS